MSGVEIIRAIQTLHNPVLDFFFYALTQLHHELFYLTVLPILYWVYDKRYVRYLVSVFLLGYWANNVLKFIHPTVRPSQLQPAPVRVIHPETATGPSFPSGHSQNTLMFWGALALQARRRWFTLFAGVLVFLIGLSRLYMGLHWPLDVLGGWVIGLVMLWGFERTRGFWVGDGMSLGRQLFWAIAIPLGSILVSMLVISGKVDATSGPVLSGLPKDIWVLGGAYLGIWAGAILEERFVGFDPRQGGVLAQILKIVVGLALVLGVKEGLKFVLPDTGAGDLIRYTCVGLLGSLGAPWVFQRFIAAPPAERRVSQ